MIGRRLSHYEITGLVGSGGMGDVYRARDVRLERDVAVKVLAPGVVGDAVLLARFEQEARALAALTHPNTVAIFDCGVEDGIAFAVMELLEGHTLAEEIRNGPVAIERAVAVALAITAGIAAAHAKGIVHRDLKPQNVFVTREGQIKILDFGLAKRIRPVGPVGNDAATMVATTPGTVLGTMAYMSPEMIDSGRAGPEADLFALGVILYEMLAGRHPFAGESAAAVMAAILRDEPPVLQGIPAELETLMRACLVKDPDRRLKSAADLEIRLRASLPERAEVSLPPTPAVPTAIDSLAVLPFHNEAHDDNADYLIDGLLDSLIDSLSTLPRLKIMARSTVLRCAHMHDRPEEVGRELGVRAVLVGRLQKRGGDIIIRTELVDAGDGSRLWGERLRRPEGDLLQIEDEICREIAGRLRFKLSPEEADRLAKRPTTNPEAREAYLQGRFVWNRWKTPDAMRTAIGFFERALKLDPTFALAYGGLADSYNILGNIKAIPPGEAYPKAKTAALQGLAIDEQAAELHTSLAFIQRFWEWSWEESRRSFERAIELNPGYATAYRFFGQLKSGLGEHDGAVASARHALELDPLSPILHTALGDTLFYARRYEQAIAAYRGCIELDGGFIPGHTDLARVLEQTGRFTEALEEFRVADALAARDVSEPSSGMAHVLARMGRREEALAIVDQLVGLSDKQYVSPYGIASIFSCLGEVETALDWLERAYRDHDQTLVWIGVHPRLDPLRAEPRFQALLVRMDLANG